MKRLGLRGGGRPDFAQGGGVEALVRWTRCAARRDRSCVTWWKARDSVQRRKALLAAAMLVLGTATSEAPQIYTRRNANGVIEATNVPDEPDFRLTYPGKGTLIHSRGFRAGVRRAGTTVTSRTRPRPGGVSSDLVRAVIAAESEFDPYAVSSKGAQGLIAAHAVDRQAVRGGQSLRPAPERLRRGAVPALPARPLLGRRVSGGRRLQRRGKRGASLQGRSALQRDPGLRAKGPGVPAGRDTAVLGDRPPRCLPPHLGPDPTPPRQAAASPAPAQQHHPPPCARAPTTSIATTKGCCTSPTSLRPRVSSTRSFGPSTRQ